MMTRQMTTRWRRRLRQALADVERYQAALDDAIARARADGATWQEVGDELGTTMQAAHARFAKRIKPKADEPGSEQAAGD